MAVHLEGRPRCPLFRNVGQRFKKSGPSTHNVPPCEETVLGPASLEHAWAREPGTTGRPSKAPLHFTSVVCSSPQMAHSLLDHFVGVEVPVNVRFGSILLKKSVC